MILYNFDAGNFDYDNYDDDNLVDDNVDDVISAKDIHMKITANTLNTNFNMRLRMKTMLYSIISYNNLSYHNQLHGRRLPETVFN